LARGVVHENEVARQALANIYPDVAA